MDSRQLNFLYADINECAYYADCCHEDATCTNTEGSFTCSCNEGFTGDGKQCEGMDAVNCNYSQEQVMIIKRIERASCILLNSSSCVKAGTTAIIHSNIYKQSRFGHTPAYRHVLVLCCTSSITQNNLTTNFLQTSTSVRLELTTVTATMVCVSTNEEVSNVLATRALWEMV